MNIIKELISISEALDKKGLYDHSNKIDRIASVLSGGTDDNSIIQEIAQIALGAVNNGDGLRPALSHSLSSFLNIDQNSSKAIANMTAEMVENGLDILDALPMSIVETLSFDSEESPEPDNANKLLLKQLGLSEDMRPMENIDLSESTLLAEQLKMAMKEGLWNPKDVD